MSARVVLIATTVLYRATIADETPYIEHEFPSDVETVLAADELAELAGRTRSQQWHRPNESTRTNRGYLREMLLREQTNEFDHASATFYIDGVSRNLTHDYFRRLTVSELSPRFTDMSEGDAVIPAPFVHSEEMTADLDEHYSDSIDLYCAFIYRLRQAGFSETECRTAAAAVLPGASDTALVVTGTMAQWREAVSKALSVSASLEQREVGTAILRKLRDVAPNTFQDMRAPGLRLVPDAVDEPEPVAA
jgi:thymidylate synthase (FAD)